MRLLSLACLIIGVATVYGNEKNTETAFTISPSFDRVGVDDEFRVLCYYQGPSNSGNLVSFDLNGEVFGFGTSKLTMNENDGTKKNYVISNYQLATATANGQLTANFSMNLKPTATGIMTVTCTKEDKSFEVIDVARIRSEQNKNSIQIEMALDSALVPDLQEGETYNFSVENPNNFDGSFSDEPNTTCPIETELTVGSGKKRLCYSNKVKQGRLAPGPYRVLYRDGEKVIAAVNVDVNASKFELTCSQAQGSKCVSDSEMCAYKCKVNGWPFTACGVEEESLEEIGIDLDKIKVDCLYAKQLIQITLFEPKQDWSGSITVWANGGIGGEKTDKSMPIRIHNKLAPLWPFLAICAEVVILCAIILFFEKRHQKRQQQQEQDEGASEPLHPAKGGEVRQRPQKA